MKTSKNTFSVVVLLLAATLGVPASLRAEDADPLKAAFKEVKETGLGLRGIYTITNVSGRDIDDIQIFLYLKDKNGETLSSSATTDATPGIVWLKAGESIEDGVPLDHRRQAKELLENRPEDGNLVIEIKSISYMRE